MYRITSNRNCYFTIYSYIIKYTIKNLMRSISTLNCQKLLVLCFKFILTSCELTLSQMSVTISNPEKSIILTKVTVCAIRLLVSIPSATHLMMRQSVRMEAGEHE